MKNIHLKLDDRSYKIKVGKDVLKDLPAVISSMGFNGPVAVITDNTVKRKTSAILDPVLERVPKLVVISVPGSERSKCIDVFQDTAQKLSRKTKKHKPLIVAVGGGVVGDLAGFVAATYRRGVPFIQVPTTLLAQVDSSVGGKVGIDLPEAKNLIGAFCQPRAVLIDTNMLTTLPKKQLRNGMAEVIKYGIIAKRSLFDLLEKNIAAIMRLDPVILEKVIHQCVSIKARVVEKDEFDRNDIRIILNFGHTLGHAIETASGYSNAFNHGESVAIGMMMASEIACELGMFRQKDMDRIRSLILAAGLPVKARGVSFKEVIRSYKYDKKFTGGTNRFVLPSGIGKVKVVEDIPEILIKNVVRKYV